MFTSLTAFPLLSFALAIYAVVTLLSGGDAAPQAEALDLENCWSAAWRVPRL